MRGRKRQRERELPATGSLPQISAQGSTAGSSALRALGIQQGCAQRWPQTGGQWLETVKEAMQGPRAARTPHTTHQALARTDGGRGQVFRRRRWLSESFPDAAKLGRGQAAGPSLPGRRPLPFVFSSDAHPAKCSRNRAFHVADKDTEVLEGSWSSRLTIRLPWPQCCARPRLRCELVALGKRPHPQK